MGKSSPINCQGFLWKGGKTRDISGRLCKLNQANSEKISNVLARKLSLCYDGGPFPINFPLTPCPSIITWEVRVHRSISEPISWHCDSPLLWEKIYMIKHLDIFSKDEGSEQGQSREHSPIIPVTHTKQQFLLLPSANLCRLRACQATGISTRTTTGKETGLPTRPWPAAVFMTSRFIPPVISTRPCLSTLQYCPYSELSFTV